MSKCLDPFRFLLISLAGWMNQQWPASPARSSRAVMTAATLASVMNGWRAGGMCRVHDFGVSCLIRGVSGALAGSSSEVSDGDVTLGWPWDSADRVFGPYGIGNRVWPENSIYLKQREMIPGVVDNEMTRCQSAWTRSASC